MLARTREAVTLAALDRYTAASDDADMPDVAAYRIVPGRPLEVIVEGRDGSRALVRGVLDSVPDAIRGGVALRIVLVDAVAEPLTE